MKRILALDGGGIRGALTLGYLQKIEDILKAKSSAPSNFRLCQHFDLIGGTSTGSIIAAALAIGMRVSEIKELYFELIGNLKNDLIGKQQPLISYLRYNTWLEANSLKNLVNKTYSSEQIAGLVVMSNADSRFELYNIGCAAANQEISANQI